MLKYCAALLDLSGVYSNSYCFLYESMNSFSLGCLKSCLEPYITVLLIGSIPEEITLMFVSSKHINNYFRWFAICLLPVSNCSVLTSTNSIGEVIS